jgi:hypothetical protein
MTDPTNLSLRQIIFIVRPFKTNTHKGQKQSFFSQKFELHLTKSNKNLHIIFHIVNLSLN